MTDNQEPFITIQLNYEDRRYRYPERGVTHACRDEPATRHHLRPGGQCGERDLYLLAYPAQDPGGRGLSGQPCGLAYLRPGDSVLVGASPSFDGSSGGALCNSLMLSSLDSTWSTNSHASL